MAIGLCRCMSLPSIRLSAIKTLRRPKNLQQKVSDTKPRPATPSIVVPFWCHVLCVSAEQRLAVSDRDYLLESFGGQRRLVTQNRGPY